jgi:hypothetical protein
VNVSSNARHKLTHAVQPEADSVDIDHEAITLIEGVDTERLQREFEAAERHHQRIAQGLVHLPNGAVQVTEDMDLLHGIEHMEKTVKRITTTHGPAIKRVKSPFTDDGMAYVLTPLGEAIWKMCCNTVPLIEQMYPACRKPAPHTPEHDVPEGVRPTFNPRLTVALDACQEAMPTLMRWSGTVPDLSQKAVRDAMEHLVGSVRSTCRSPRFKYVQTNYERAAQENFKEACNYISALFADNSRLLCCRVDIYFLPDSRVWADIDAAKQCFDRFLRALRESRIAPDVKGFVIRSENGIRRGIHLHVMIAMDGHKHREAASWSQVIGETWVHQYSQGHGTYFNCYTRKDAFRFNGLGLVHVRDWRKLIGIREALRYMTKADFHIATGYKKNFRKGWMPSAKKSKTTKKRGAPRKAEHSMQLVEQILRHV